MLALLLNQISVEDLGLMSKTMYTTHYRQYGGEITSRILMGM